MLTAATAKFDKGRNLRKVRFFDILIESSGEMKKIKKGDLIKEDIPAMRV